MYKLTQILQDNGAQVQVSTLKELFNKLFASDKDVAINNTFWSTTQWKKGIEDIGASGVGDSQEHWFHVDTFNPLILKIDTNYKTLIEKITAFVDYVKTVDPSFTTEADPLDDTTLLKRCYITLFQNAMRSDFSNLDNPKPENVMKLINKLGVASKYAAKIQNTILRLSRPPPVSEDVSASFVIKNGSTVVKEGSFANITKSFVEVAQKLYEYEIYLEKGVIEVKSVDALQNLELIINISNLSNVQISSFSGRVNFLQSPISTESFLDTFIYNIKPVNVGKDIIIKAPMHVACSTKHVHYISAKVSYPTGTVDKRATGVVNANAFYSFDGSYSDTVNIAWHGKLLETFKIDRVAKTSPLVEAVALKNYGEYVDGGYSFNSIKIQNFTLRGIMCLP